MPVEPKPARRWKRIALVAAAVLVVGVLAVLAVRPSNGIWVDDLEAELNRDLPEGATAAEAEAWFTSRGFFHHSGISFNLRDIRQLPGGGIGAIVPNSTLFEYAEIDIEVLFDANGRVCKRYIRRWVRCL
jgi:hypothetical protein